MRGRKPIPTALRRASGNPGKRGYNRAEPIPPPDMPGCPDHLGETAREEWHRIAGTLHEMGVLTSVDRAALAAYCQCYGRWVEAEIRLKETPALLRTPSGYVQQSPWLAVANKQLELMGRFMAELGITPASRSRVAARNGESSPEPYVFHVVFEDREGTLRDADGEVVGEAEDLPCIRPMLL